MRLKTVICAAYYCYYFSHSNNCALNRDMFTKRDEAGRGIGLNLNN